MVLADRGVVCIDEFDKMSEEDRVAIHEVMEQQTVTIAKAGIHASLNARCSVIAAANPIYGHYNRAKRPTENIGLPDSLLSRFDMLFIVLDTMAPERDRAIGEHVLRMHRYREPGGGNANVHLGIVDDHRRLDASSSLALAGASAAFQSPGEGQDSSIYQPYDRLLHAHRDRNEPIFSIAFLKKYILYAKNCVHPVLTQEASEHLAQAFADLRSKEQVKTLPVTPRTLETLIRISTAAARVRLSSTITRQDTMTALEIMNFSLFHEVQQSVGEDDRNEERLPTASATDQVVDDDDNDDDEKDGGRRKRDRAVNGSDARQKRPVQEAERKEAFVLAVSELLSYEDAVNLEQLREEINDNNPTPFSQDEFTRFLQQLNDDGKVMVDQNTVYRC